MLWTCKLYVTRSERANVNEQFCLYLVSDKSIDVFRGYLGHVYRFMILCTLNRHYLKMLISLNFVVDKTIFVQVSRDILISYPHVITKDFDKLMRNCLYFVLYKTSCL